ncbi:uncharacterized protein LOC100571833 [Acyrthosiphon pisum]|uniref:Uncharacterized protein n=1 Tax=Acyrthosiphon pisum TaxID=7029 RepID=A0A8R1X3K8_ACYPI|nr:uncharacterized protein LOC100571833 [Acyrthosiphon pisum]|eukprot:XP_008179815.2 PREDICTED: uncharacterized protein LOC100571833 [Acyrthosiphon pisum]
MDKSEGKKSAGLKETNKTEQYFIGFDIDDDVLIIIENKKKFIKMELSKETGEPMEVEDASIVNNNQVNKKIQSRSNISSLEPNDVKNNWSNKRLKKENLRSDALEQVPPTLELTTPTFNFTSSNTRTSRSRGKKINVDIRDAIYKLPFKHGWKRELVYRTSGESTILNRTNRNGDVYYYSPTNQKLRSLREIQEQLDILSDKDLTIESFTFLKQPIGMNDRSKELIRDANSKLSKEDSFVGVAVKPKKSKTSLQRPPFDFELSDDENNKSSSKMKIVFKNTRSFSTLKSKKGISESMNTSSSTPEYISEDCQATQSSASPKVSSPKLEKIEITNTIVKRRNSEINGSLREIVTPSTSMQSFNYMAIALRHVFKYLKMDELLSASRVCTAWNIIAMNKTLWQNVRLKNSMVYDWEKFVDSIDQQLTDTLDTRRMLMPSKVEDFESFWLQFARAMKRAQQLKFIDLYRCPVTVVEDIIYSLPQIKVLSATSIKNPNLMKEMKDPNDLMYINLNYLGQMTMLTDLRLKGLTGMKLTGLSSFENLIHLKRLSLTSFKVFPKEIYKRLNTITDNIEFFEIGDCESLTKDFAVPLKRFVNLKTLRLENCCNEWDQSAQDVFTVIRGLEKLNVLELVNIEFSNCVEEELEKCDGIKALLIIPAYMSQSATTNRHLIECLKKLSKTLTHLIWGLTHELLRVTDLFITQYLQNRHTIGYNLELSHTNKTTDNIPILRTRRHRQQPDDQTTPEKENPESDNVDILSVPDLEKMLETMMPNAKTKIVKVPFSGTTRVYLSDHLNNL